MMSINKIDFNELNGRQKKLGKRSRVQTSEKIGVIPPYTLATNGNSNSLLKTNPYQKFEDKGIVCSGFDKYASKSALKISDDPQKESIVMKHL
jgi:hypothetical protein